MVDHLLHFEHFVPYREFAGKPRPLVLAELRAGDRLLNQLMLIDSGADNLVLPAISLPHLGLEPADCVEQSARTAFGVVSAYQGPEVILAMPDIDATWSLRARAFFSPFIDHFGYGLIGRDPAFDLFRLAFDHRFGSGFFITLYRE